MKKLNKLLTAIYFAVFCISSLTLSASAANKIESSNLGTGTKNLISDATAWLVGIAAVVGIICVVYFFIRRGMSDEMDEKKWNNRIQVAIVSTVLAVIASGLINLIVGYYQT